MVYIPRILITVMNVSWVYGLGECFSDGVEMDVCAASPRPDSLTLRGSVELAWTLLKGALDAPGQLQTIYGHREHM